ncbi:hypothetical protein SDC9_81827 [bioreactor metagenome]|uniref:Uncharacterized protein n=1 Tax=bioreactor metagenome TaxID=1076179 RepID=A0A644Z3Q5_9ZZZZ
MIQAVEVVTDRPDRRPDDGLVERGEEHPRHQRVDDEQDLPVVHHRVGRSCAPRVGRGRGDDVGHGENLPGHGKRARDAHTGCPRRCRP